MRVSSPAELVADEVAPATSVSSELTGTQGSELYKTRRCTCREVIVKFLPELGNTTRRADTQKVHTSS